MDKVISLLILMLFPMFFFFLLNFGYLMCEVACGNSIFIILSL